MPNWCQNETFVYGKTENVADFMLPFSNGNVFDTMSDFCFLKHYAPCPEALLSFSAVVNPDEVIPEGWSILVEDGTWTQDEYDESVANFLSDREIARKNRERYGYTGWYDWCVDNWGSKWGMCDTTCGGLYYENSSNQVYANVYISYDTAWSPITVGIERVSLLFPNLIFTTFYEEHGMGFAGVHQVADGEVIRDDCSDLIPASDDYSFIMDGMDEQYVDTIVNK